MASAPQADAVMCASLAAYGLEPDNPAPAAPTAGPMPSVAPDAVPSSGVLEVGDVAVLGDAQGPGALLRVADVRVCDRYPDLRPMTEGMRFVVVREELVILRDGYLAPWIALGAELAVRREDMPESRWATTPAAAGLPGVDMESSRTTSAGFAWASDAVYEVAGGPETRLYADYRYAADAEVPGTPAVVSWDLGILPAAPAPDPWELTPPTPAPNGSSGRVSPDTLVTVRDGGEAYVLVAGRVGQVTGYPGLEPEQGAFVEVEVRYGAEHAGAGIGEWRAVDGAGGELAFLRAGERDAVLQPQLRASPWSGWLAIDAPARGEIRLEYRRNGEGPVLFEVLVRQG